MQTTSHLLMIRPLRFEFNQETAVNNSFQSQSLDDNTAELARVEFDQFVELLRSKGIDITVVEDTADPHTPDSVFPNNWISFHSDGTIVLYPMFAVNRRAERKPHVLARLAEKFEIRNRIDLTPLEQESRFLEGTGSLVLDRQNLIAYACLSPRTDQSALDQFCRKMNFRPIAFVAVDSNDLPIYHTNVMMCVADRYAVVCLDSVKDPEQKMTLTRALTDTGKRIIPISLEQMNHFAGNMLQVQNNEGQSFLVMSSQAYNSLEKNQIMELEKFNPILHSSLNNIEKNGGGSARCMLAEVFLPVQQTTRHH
jgi:hypothetical protein